MTTGGRIALTFDDGRLRGQGHVLVLGPRAAARGPSWSRIHAEGHAIGLHHHLDHVVGARDALDL